MQQTIFAAAALVVVIMGISEPACALSRDDCQRAGGQWQRAIVWQISSAASRLMRGKQDSLVSF
jgi:hypothetical protein